MRTSSGPRRRSVEVSRRRRDEDPTDALAWRWLGVRAPDVLVADVRRAGRQLRLALVLGSRFLRENSPSEADHGRWSRARRPRAVHRCLLARRAGWARRRSVCVAPLGAPAACDAYVACGASRTPATRARRTREPNREECRHPK